MTAALQYHGKEPVREFPRWSTHLTDISPAFNNGYVPSIERPLVYHLHGIETVPESIVLTTDDYVEYLYWMIKDMNRSIPRVITKAIAERKMLYIGYSLIDLNFQVLLRAFRHSGLRGDDMIVAGLGLNHIAIRNYLHKQRQDLVYWGDCQDFSRDLFHRWHMFIK